MPIRRLHHAVLYVRDAKASAKFYTEVLGFEIIGTMGDTAIFLRPDGAQDPMDHFGLFTVGQQPRQRPDAVGLYHLAWQVHTIEDLAELRAKLVAAGSLVGESDHGGTKSLYARDIDGIEFEIMWAVPEEHRPEQHGIWPLDLEAALTQFAGVDTAS